MKNISLNLELQRWFKIIEPKCPLDLIISNRGFNSLKHNINISKAIGSANYKSTLELLLMEDKQRRGQSRFYLNLARKERNKKLQTQK